MNKNILCLSVGLCLCAWVYPAMAQKASSGTATVPATKVKKIEVKDYKSFEAYVANEESTLKNKPLNTDNGPVRDNMRKIGIEFRTNARWAKSPDNTKTAFLSPDKKGIAIVDGTRNRVDVMNPEGKLVQSVNFSKYPDGTIAFSDSRLFLLKSGFGKCFGFDMYDYKGALLKSVEGICIDAYTISNTQKYFAITGGPKGECYLILYDMDGTELWRKKTIAGANTEIRFSNNDKFVLLKLPIYWDPGENNSIKKNKLYLFDIENKKTVSEETYEK